MRIAFISIHGYVDPVPKLGLTDTGGQVVYVIEMAKHLAKLGINIDIFTRLFEGRGRIEYVSKKVRIIRIPCGPDMFLRKEELYPYLDEYSENLTRFVANESLRYDIIHSHYWDAGYVALKLKEKLNVPIAHTSHSLGLIKRLFLGELGKKVDYRFEIRINIEKKILAEADLIVSASPVEQEYVSRLYGINRKFEVVPPGVDTKYFSPENVMNIKLPEKYIFTTGRFEWTKGFDLLVRAFPYVVMEHSDVYLIVGGGSLKPTHIEKQVREEIWRIAREGKVEKNIIQTGRIPNEELPTYYAKSALTVLPSRYDLFGMVAIEALACGRPVVVSKYAGAHRMIGRYGLIADPFDEEDLASKILWLLDHPEKANKMGIEGRKFVEKNMSWEALAKKLLSIYRSFLESEG